MWSAQKYLEPDDAIWGNRDDTVVCDEPRCPLSFTSRKSPHPGAHEVTPRRESTAQSHIPAHRPIPQPTNHFQKHMTPTISCRRWARIGLVRLTNCFLIRFHPREVLASYVKNSSSAALEDYRLPQAEGFSRRVHPAPGHG